MKLWHLVEENWFLHQCFALTRPSVKAPPCASSGCQENYVPVTVWRPGLDSVNRRPRWPGGQWYHSCVSLFHSVDHSAGFTWKLNFLTVTRWNPAARGTAGFCSYETETCSSFQKCQPISLGCIGSTGVGLPNTELVCHVASGISALD